MLRTLVAAAFLIVGAGSLRAQAPAEKAEKPADIDLVICLDVSSSMNGLINSAKAKLWDIVNEFAKAKPTPNLRVGLYSYGHTTYDPKTGWVRKELDFTRDLDQVNDKLFGLRTGGGTELVARVCKAALDQQEWSGDTKALKIIFVCGNESADQDREHSLKSVAEQAVRRGIVINSIFCGPEGSTIAAGWRDFALLAEGRYAAINQNRAVAAAPATPFDKKIAELGVQLGDTYLFVGGQRREFEANQKKQDANAAQLGAGVAAERAVTKATGLYRFEKDLVERAQKNESLDLDKLAEAELPEALRALPKAEREQKVKETAGKRTALQKQILELNQQRERFLREAAAARPNQPGGPGFDDALRGAIRDQAKARGIKLEK